METDQGPEVRVAKLFTPLSVGALQLSHRIVTPLGVGQQPHPFPFDEYVQRVTQGGLVITGPRWLTPECVPRWRVLVEAVHARGGLIVNHVSHPMRMYGNEVDLLDQQRIDVILDELGVAATLALRAGFDGVELDATTNSVFGQFLQDSTNRRSDRYGGTPEARVTLLSEAVQVLIDTWTTESVSVRVSPWASHDDDPRELFKTVVSSLSDQEIAYINLAHMEERSGAEEAQGDRELGATLRAASSTALFFSGRYSRKRAIELVDRRVADAIGFHDASDQPDFISQLVDAA